MTPFTNLTLLTLDSNNISDIAALSGLTHLDYLYLANNSISNITALSDLTDLSFVTLSGNDISDIAPLVENQGIDDGDSVSLEENPLDCQNPTTQSHLATLEDRGVSLGHDCA